MELSLSLFLSLSLSLPVSTCSSQKHYIARTVSARIEKRYCSTIPFLSLTDVYYIYRTTRNGFYIHLYSPIYMVAEIRKTATTTTERKKERNLIIAPGLGFSF